MADNSITFELKEMLPRITEQVASALRERAIQAFQYNATEAVGKEVQRYVQEVIVPEVTKELEANKAQLIAIMVAAVHAIAEMTAEQMKKQATENLTKYGSEKLIGAFVKNILTGKEY